MTPRDAQAEFDPERLLRVLTEHGVRFVLIGGWAGVLHGSPSVTVDLDVCYDRRTDNLDRLATALASLDARPRGFPAGLPFRLDRPALRAGDVFTLETTAGDLDVLGAPAGATGYDELLERALELDLDDFQVLVCSLDDLIRMKEAAGRPKDLVEVPILRALLRETGRDPG